jgi:methionyl-tRNA formyltransferase
MDSLSIVFAGTPQFTCPSLSALHASKHRLTAVYTQPDRPAGRGRKLQASAAKEWALAHAVPVYQPLNFKQEEDIEQLAALAPDVMVVIAYGLILPKRVLDIPRFGCINVHASLLPRWRGASPIQQAILHGDVETGVTIMQMDVGMDTGDMLSREACFIDQNSAGQLHDRLAQLAVTPLLSTLDAIASHQTKPVTQENKAATYAPKITKDDAAISWQKPAIEIERHIRAFNPWPITYTHIADTTLRIFSAKVIKQNTQKPPGTILSIDKDGLLIATGKDALLVDSIQFPGSKRMSVAEWMNASRPMLQVTMVCGL